MIRGVASDQAAFGGLDRQEVGESVGVEGLGKDEPLGQVATDGLERVVLRWFLDAFGDGFEVKRVGELDDRLHEGIAVRLEGEGMRASDFVAAVTPAQRDAMRNRYPDQPAGKFLFLNDWPDVYAAASKPGPGNDVVGKFGVVALPGLNGPGSSSLGGANLAISAYSQHQQTALDFISFLTDLPADIEFVLALIWASSSVWTRWSTTSAMSHPEHRVGLFQSASDRWSKSPANSAC